MRKILKTFFASLGAFCLFFVGGCGTVNIFNLTGEIYYETTIEFYVTPKNSEAVTGGDGSRYGVYGAYGEQVMANMIKLLESESFYTVLLEEMNEETRETFSDSVARIGEYVEYGYLESYSETDTVDPLARSFIYAKISVSEKEGRAFAENLRSAVIEKTPSFVEENMVIPEGYSGTHCGKITRSDDLKEVRKG